MFLFNIVPAEPDVDDWLWVIVGDVPPAYLVTDVAPNPACPLRAYIREMSAWVEAARTGKPVDELIPVNAPPTPHYASALAGRLEMLEAEVLGGFEDDLMECQNH